jgi:hypothetical protein
VNHDYDHKAPHIDAVATIAPVRTHYMLPKEALEMRIVRETCGGDIQTPRRDHAAATPHLADAASGFSERVSKTQEVAVYAFDGAKEIHPIVGFTTGGGSVAGGINALRTYKPRDPSTNLNGAVIEALATLSKQMEHAQQPLRFGTLVVFTDGTDHAHRVSTKTHEGARRGRRQIGVFVIGVGAEIDSG